MRETRFGPGQGEARTAGSSWGPGLVSGVAAGDDGYGRHTAQVHLKQAADMGQQQRGEARGPWSASGYEHQTLAT